jgi:DNA-binding MarR family transcriptional regulator
MSVSAAQDFDIPASILETLNECQLQVLLVVHEFQSLSQIELKKHFPDYSSNKLSYALKKLVKLSLVESKPYLFDMRTNLLTILSFS